jgi:hypothetical protein
MLVPVLLFWVWPDGSELLLLHGQQVLWQQQQVQQLLLPCETAHCAAHEQLSCKRLDDDAATWRCDHCDI